MRLSACAGVAALVIALLSTGGAGAHLAVESDCGKPIAKTDGTMWECTFADYFDGAALDTTHWSALTTKGTGLGDPHCLVDSPNNVSVRDGSLHLTIREERTPFSAGPRSRTWSDPM